MDYLKALERAILYIENHLGEDIKAEDAAAATGYSYYHFTRQFNALLGESVGSYIRKRRIAKAAKELLYTDRRILDIALDCGFESAESFSRAFKSLYLTSPVSYRKNRLDLFIGSKPQLEGERLTHITKNLTVHPVIVELPDIMAAGLRGSTTLNDNVLPGLWAAFMEMSHQIPHQIPGGRGFGICEACGQGNTLYSMNGDVLFSEVAAVEVSSFDGLPAPFVPKIIKGGRYAVFTHTGSLSLLQDSYFQDITTRNPRLISISQFNSAARVKYAGRHWYCIAQRSTSTALRSAVPVPRRAHLQRSSHRPHAGMDSLTRLSPPFHSMVSITSPRQFFTVTDTALSGSRISICSWACRALTK